MEKLNYIYGINPVIETIKAKKYKIEVVYLFNTYNKILMLLLKQNNINYIIKSKEELNNIFSNNQGVIAKISNWETLSLKSLIQNAKLKSKVPFFVMLDQVEDPNNFGAIIRICDLFNVSGIIILNVRQSQMNSTVAKISSGAFNYVPLCVVNNLSNAIRVLKKELFWIYATSFSDKSEQFDNLKYDSPTVLILGNEGKGVSKKILTLSDFEIHIKTYGNVDSLNVSSASSILIYKISKELRR